MSVATPPRVIVVGSGNAALSAAIAAAEQGADVTVLEKAPADEAGGNTWYTAGAFRVSHEGLGQLGELLGEEAEPHLSRTDLPPYSVAAYLEDLNRLTGGRADPKRAEVLAAESFEGVRWLHDHGVPFTLMYNRQAYEHDGIFRFWGGLALGVDGGGKKLVATELEAARRLGVEPRFETPVSELLRDDDGAVRGVALADGRRWDGDAVILCCGGFQGNRAMLAEHLGPAWAKAKLRGTSHNTGDGHRMALAAGAAKAGDWGSCHAVAWDASAPDTGDRELTNRFTKQSYPLGILVDRSGERFFDEGADFRNYTYAMLGAAIIEQADGIAFLLFDAKTIPLLREEEYEVPGVRRLRAERLEDLAAAAGIDPAGLRRTVEEFNAAAGEGRFDPTRIDGKRTNGIEPPKSNWAQPLDTAPFEVVAVTCGITFTFGGLSTDLFGRVLDGEERPIPGLFAAGELAGGLFADNYPGGSGLSAGTVFGRRSGRAAVRDLAAGETGVAAEQGGTRTA